MQTQTETQEARSTATFEELYGSYATDVLRVCYFYLCDVLEIADHAAGAAGGA